ncbi:hypothetical protein, partial [Lysinibacillus sphaericus]|uniref:hypothetical protein n=1 Tax=Lysinibacillus sphaericus TaxID=1421 RepID=UPI001CA51A80
LSRHYLVNLPALFLLITAQISPAFILKLMSSRITFSLYFLLIFSTFINFKDILPTLFENKYYFYSQYKMPFAR